MDVVQVMREDRVVAVIRARRIPDPAALAGTFAAAGVRSVEFTFTVPDAADAIRAASASGAVVGAGTVLSICQAEMALEAEAKFLVSPSVVPGLVEVAGDVPVFLGAFTPTEIHSAVDAGRPPSKSSPPASAVPPT